MEIQELVAKAKAIEEEVATCEHEYKSQGFSKIAHPELVFARPNQQPDVKQLSEIQYASWYCAKCGNRISTGEYHDYENERLRKLRELEELQEINRRYKFTD